MMQINKLETKIRPYFWFPKKLDDFKNELLYESDKNSPPRVLVERADSRWDKMIKLRCTTKQIDFSFHT